MKYRQLTPSDRCTIARLRAHAYSQTEIAHILGRHRSTISRELKRNRCSYDGGYRAFKAQRRTNGRRRRSRSHPQITVSQWVTVTRYLRRDWSPEQIANTLAEQGKFRIHYSPKVSRQISQRQEGIDPDIIEIAWTAQTRLHRRYMKLKSRGMHQNKVITAVARELIAFIWSAARQVPLAPEAA